MKPLISALVACSLLSAPISAPVYASGVPDLGDSAQQVLSRKAEQALGDSIMAEIRMDSAVIDDVEARDYLNRLGNRLASVSNDRHQRFEFFVVNDATLNAFALPGGYIGVHTGLISTTQSESELAAVLSHEIAHVTQRHISRFLEKDQTIGMASLALLAIGILAASKGGQLPEATIAASQALQIQGKINFTRAHETEADSVGMQYLAAAGFDPHAMSTFFGRMEKAARVYGEGAPVYLRTHPLESTRLAESANRADQYPYKQVAESVEFHLIRERLRALNGSESAQVAYFENALKERRFNLEAASQYGLAVALLRNGQPVRAQQALDQARKLLKHPMLESLGAEILIKQGKLEAAGKVYETALALTPNHVGLNYGLIRCRLLQKRAVDAEHLASAQIESRSSNGPFYALLAEAYTQQGNEAAARQAQGEFYYRQGQLNEAIIQLQMALQVKGLDFYRQAGIEARLKEWQSEQELIKAKS